MSHDDWCGGVPIQDIEKRFSKNPFQGAVASGDIRPIADSTRYYLRSAHQIAVIVRPGDRPDPEAMEQLMRQLEFGLPKEVLTLLDLRLSLGRGEYLALAQAGIRSSTDFLEAEEERLTTVLGPSRTPEICRARARHYQHAQV